MKTTLSILRKVRAPSSLHPSHLKLPLTPFYVWACVDFFNKVWLGWTLAGLTAVGFYKYAPAAGEGTYLTDVINHYNTSREVWNRINLKHLVLSAEEQSDVLTVAHAKSPPVHRYRFPQ